MRFPNPFALPGRWFKACLHVHSTASDGRLTPEEVLTWYRRRGYHVVALTDHGVLSEARSVAGGFITLAGIEIDGVDPVRGFYHMVGLGVQESPDPASIQNLPQQQAVDRLCQVGGLVILAHPYWTGQMSKDLLGLERCFALEIYNGGCEVDNARGFSTVHWDDLLAAGQPLWGLAVDDAHWRNGARDAGLGWVWVKASELTPPAILKALAEGYFYASSGPQIHDLQVDVTCGEVSVRCSPVVVIDFVGKAWLSRRVTAPPGLTLTQASYQWRQGQRYVRIACQDGQGNWAWSNPVFLE